MRENKFILRIVVVFAICLAGMVIFLSCKKNDSTVPPSEFDGIFAGTYTLTNLHHGFTWNKTSTIEFENGEFKYNRGDCTGLCCSGGGIFTITGNTIIFKEIINNNGPTPYIYCGDTFDSKYEFKFDGDSLFLSNTDSMFSTEFKLKKETGR